LASFSPHNPKGNRRTKKSQGDTDPKKKSKGHFFFSSFFKRSAFQGIMKNRKPDKKKPTQAKKREEPVFSQEKNQIQLPLFLSLEARGRNQGHAPKRK